MSHAPSRSLIAKAVRIAAVAIGITIVWAFIALYASVTGLTPPEAALASAILIAVSAAIVGSVWALTRGAFTLNERLKRWEQHRS